MITTMTEHLGPAWEGLTDSLENSSEDMVDTLHDVLESDMEILGKTQPAVCLNGDRAVSLTDSQRTPSYYTCQGLRAP
jgi:hypothetical protein